MPDSFENAARLLPDRLRQAARLLPENERLRAEEIRLRVGREPSILLPEGEKAFCRGKRLCQSELRAVLEAATGSSIHSASRDMARGFLTARGGVRIGMCGVLGGERMRELSSLAMRIPRQLPTDGRNEIELLSQTRESVLVISPPGGGKTTFLRELVRTVSDSGIRIALADERGEVAAVFEGEPQFDVGRCTDVLTGGTKAEGALLLLRALNPQIIALDEITAPEDLAAIEQIAGCGVGAFATAHASGTDELMLRPLYRRLLALGIFKKAVIIHRNGARREYRVEKL